FVLFSFFFLFFWPVRALSSLQCFGPHQSCVCVSVCVSVSERVCECVCVCLSVGIRDGARCSPLAHTHTHTHTHSHSHSHTHSHTHSFDSVQGACISFLFLYLNIFRSEERRGGEAGEL